MPGWLQQRLPVLSFGRRAPAESKHTSAPATVDRLPQVIQYSSSTMENARKQNPKLS